MKLYVLFKQDECSYQGEYDPEPVEITNEYVMDENPDWMSEKIKEYEDDPMVESVKLIVVNVGDESIWDAFRLTEVDGEVSES